MARSLFCCCIQIYLYIYIWLLESIYIYSCVEEKRHACLYLYILDVYILLGICLSRFPKEEKRSIQIKDIIFHILPWKEMEDCTVYGNGSAVLRQERLVIFISYIFSLWLDLQCHYYKKWEKHMQWKFFGFCYSTYKHDYFFL